MPSYTVEYVPSGSVVVTSVTAETFEISPSGYLAFQTGDDVVAVFRDWCSVVEVPPVPVAGTSGLMAGYAWPKGMYPAPPLPPAGSGGDAYRIVFNADDEGEAK